MSNFKSNSNTNITNIEYSIDINDILFILGSGASVDSGLPTYRGPSGIYNGDFSPEQFFSDIDIEKDIDKVWDYFRPLLISSISANPGPTYSKIKEILELYPKSSIITQNIDGLIAKALDSSKVPIVELHGNNRNMICLNCNLKMPINLDNLYCHSCGNKCRPDITCFGESLDNDKFQKCIDESVKKYKYIIVLGTTLRFRYLKYFISNALTKSSKIIHINPDDDYIDSFNINNPVNIWIKLKSVEGLEDFIKTYHR